MVLKSFLAVMLASTVAVAVAPTFPLGIGYSQWLVPNVRKLAVDNAGAIYVLSASGISGANTPPSTVTKLSPDGNTIVWQNQLSIAVSTMAVDPNGGVYVAPINLGTPVQVSKLNDNGSGIAWTLSTGLTFPFGFLPTLAADSNGRVYVSGFGGSIVRLAANGTSIEYTKPLGGMPTSIAVDPSGAAYVTGIGSVGFLARFAPDGTPGFNVAVPQGSAGTPTVVLDPRGNPVVYANGTLTRYDAAGNQTSTKTILTADKSFAALTLDQAGNAYILGSSRTAYYPVKNTLAPCGTEFLTVIGPDGSVLQTTYLPGAAYNTLPLIAIGKDGNVLMAAWPGQSYAPSRPGPLPAGQAPATSFLLSLSGTSTPDVYPLACIVNGGGYQIGPVSPGQLLTLFGNGLGPQQGVQPPASVQTPYPTRAGNVEVTFDGVPAPISWAQDGQVNVVSPWSLNTSKNTEVCVSNNGVKLKCVNWPTAATSPGVFTVGDSTYAIALNQDGSVNSADNPATVGSVVSVFATGTGPITPAQADGSLINFPLPNNVVFATVDALVLLNGGPRGPVFGTMPTELTYSGPAPYRVAGISQINFRLLSNAASYQVKSGSAGSQQFSIHVRQN